MKIDAKQRVNITKGIVAGGLTLIGLATGSPPFFALLIATSISVGADLLADVAGNLIEGAHYRWMGNDLVSDKHLRLALKKSFIHAIRSLESAWKSGGPYHRLIYQKKHERAKLSLTLLREFLSDSKSMFDDEQQLQDLMLEVVSSRQVATSENSVQSTSDLLASLIDEYFGIVEPLANLAKEMLFDEWVVQFGSYLKSEQGGLAWRSYQKMLQECLSVEVSKTKSLAQQSRDEAVQNSAVLQEIQDWLHDWESKLSALNPEQRDKTGQEAFEKELRDYQRHLDESLESLRASTNRILEILDERFLSLDDDQVMVNFIQKELLRDQYVNLQQSGHHAEEYDVSLAKVFVDLPVSTSYQAEHREEDESDNELPPGIVAEIVTASGDHLDPVYQRMLSDRVHNQDPVNAPDGSQQGRYVIVGGPGQGKTTLSQFICQLFRVAILKKRKDTYYDKVDQSVSELNDISEREGIDFPIIPRIPFRIELSEFAAKLATDDRNKVTSLINYITYRIRNLTDQPINENRLREWLSRYPWIVIFDGLDEVPSSSNRDQVIQAIDDFMVDVNSQNADVLFLATTRPQGYGEEFSPRIYSHRWLLPLSDARSMHYAERLISVRYRQDSDRRQKIAERLRSAVSDESTVRLMRSPLQVTIMTALVDRIGKPPQERWSLFNQYYNVIYQREMERNIPAATILRNHEANINAIHYRVGLLLQIESEQTGKTGARLSVEKFGLIVEQRLTEEGHIGHELESITQNIIEAAATRLVFLVGVEVGEVGFEIRSLQEFMAAESLMEGGDDLVGKRLHRIAPIDNWRNVFLFAAGKCFAERQHLRDTVRGICTDLNESADQQPDLCSILLTGSELALDLLEDGPARYQPKYAKGLARLALRLIDLPAIVDHSRLSELYYPMLEDVYIDEIERRLREDRGGAYLGAWTVIIPLARRKIEWAVDLAEEFWPRSEKKRVLITETVMPMSGLDWILDKSPKSAFRVLGDSPDGIARYRIAGRHDDRSTSSHMFYEITQNMDKNYNKIHVSVRLPSLRPLESPIVSATSSVPSWLKLIKEQKLDYGNWLPYMAAYQYLSAPSHLTLAKALRMMESGSTSADQRTIASQANPWPLAVLAQYSSKTEHDNDIPKLVEQGVLGNLDAWLAAERRWQQHGVSLEDVSYLPSHGLPFDSNISEVGYPYSLIFRSDSLGGSESIQGLIDLYSLLPSTSDNRSYIGDQLVILILISNKKVLGFMSLADDSVQHKISLSLMQQLVSDSMTKHFYLELLECVEVGEDEYKQFVGLLDQIGRNKRIVSLGFHPSPSKFFTTLAMELSAKYKEDRSLIGLPRLISCIWENSIVQDRHRSQLPIPADIVEMDSSTESVVRPDIIVIQLAQSQWYAQTEDLKNDIVETHKSHPELLLRVLHTLITRDVWDSPTVDLLLALFSTLRDTGDSSVLSTFFHSLKLALVHQTSSPFKNWDSFGLPKRLNRILG